MAPEIVIYRRNPYKQLAEYTACCAFMGLPFTTIHPALFIIPFVVFSPFIYLIFRDRNDDMEGRDLESTISTEIMD